jgi:hypothetical protein
LILAELLLGGLRLAVAVPHSYSVSFDASAHSAAPGNAALWEEKFLREFQAMGLVLYPEPPDHPACESSGSGTNIELPSRLRRTRTLFWFALRACSIAVTTSSGFSTP